MPRSKQTESKADGPVGESAGRSPPRRAVVLVTAGFGADTEVWIYRHAVGLKRYECHVAALSHVNRRTFPHPSVHLMDHRNVLLHRLLQLRCALGTLRWPSTRRTQVWRLERIIAKARADLVHVHFLWNAELAMRAAAGQGVPFVVNANGDDVHRARANAEYRAALQPVFRAASRIVAVSDYLADKLVEIGCPRDKVRRIYLIAPVPEGRADVGSQGERLNVLCVASFREKKGHLYLLQAFARAREKDPRLFLTLVGDGKLRPQIEETIRELGIAQSVELMGWATPARVRQLLEASHIYAQHSVEVEVEVPGFGPALSAEGLPTSIMEAAAFALPVVATRNAGIPEICRHGHNGFLVEERDVRDMGERMLELARDPELRRRFGSNGRALVEKEFDAARQLAKLEALYDEVLAPVQR